MQLVGEWYLCDDSISRPTILADIRLPGYGLYGVRFLLDTGADRTVLTADLVPDLPPLSPSPEGEGIAGLGGAVAFGMVTGALEFQRDPLGPIAVRGTFVVLTQPAAADMCVLGRDVMDHFDVVVSRRHDSVLLLGGSHRFAVSDA